MGEERNRRVRRTARAQTREQTLRMTGHARGRQGPRSSRDPDPDGDGARERQGGEHAEEGEETAVPLGPEVSGEQTDQRADHAHLLERRERRGPLGLRELFEDEEVRGAGAGGRDRPDRTVENVERRKRPDVKHQGVERGETDVVPDEEPSPVRVPIGKMAPNDRREDERRVVQRRRDGDVFPATVEGDQDQEGQHDAEPGGRGVDRHEREQPGSGDETARPRAQRGGHGGVFLRAPPLSYDDSTRSARARRAMPAAERHRRHDTLIKGGTSRGLSRVCRAWPSDSY